VPVLGEHDPVLDSANLPASAAHMASVDWAVEWRPGTRRSRRASLTLTPAGAIGERIDLEPVLDFQMLGIGYLHPRFSHGVWLGEQVVEAESWRLDELDPSLLPNLHVQQLVRATWGERVGTGVFEQLCIGPHEPSGLANFDMAPPEPR
jgi:hypothetical protein